MCTYTCMYIYIYTRTCIKVPPDVYRMLLDIYQDSGQARYLIVCVCVCVCVRACVYSSIHRRYTLELDGCSAYTCIPLNIYIDDICRHAYI